MFGCSVREGRQRASRLLDEVGIGAERRFQLRKFSKGMVQRVGIAQALINEPEVIFLDEPMSGLDPLGRRDVRELILRLRDRGCTVFFSSHVLSDAEALCSRVAILAKGRLAAERIARRAHGISQRGDGSSWSPACGTKSCHASRPHVHRRRRSVTVASRWSCRCPHCRSKSFRIWWRPERASSRSIRFVARLEDFFVEQVRAADTDDRMGRVAS